LRARAPPEGVNLTGAGGATHVRNLHNFGDGIQYAVGNDCLTDMLFVHLMHDSVDTVCHGG